MPKNNELGIELFKKSKKELVRLILENQEIQIPLSIFLGRSAPLESVVKYLRENKQFSIKEIALRLNRHEQTIWTTYRHSKSMQLNLEHTKYHIPLSLLSKENNAVMETVCFYLKDFCNLTHTEIAAILRRSMKTVWTSYSRYVKKNKVFGGIKNE